LKKSLQAALALGAVFAASHAAAQVTFYSQEGLRGRAFAVNGTIDNFDGSGFNDRASSAIVERGRWEVCEHARFNGRCVLLRPGQYPSLSALGLDNSVSSVRRFRGNSPRAESAPPPPAPAQYAWYPRHGERLFEADVVAVRAVMGAPEQRCWVEQEQVIRERREPNVPGAIVGGIIGGVIGHQIGSGRGNDVATAVGAIGGAAIGANVDRPRGGRVYVQDVQRCTTVPGSHPSYYDVTYVFRGQTHRAQLAFAPGRTITVNGNGEPRV
jgi:uncharacterized protein YcfJ